MFVLLLRNENCGVALRSAFVWSCAAAAGKLLEILAAVIFVVSFLKKATFVNCDCVY